MGRITLRKVVIKKMEGFSGFARLIVNKVCWFLPIFWAIILGCATQFPQLQKDINHAPYSIHDYKYGVFDCSNMSHLLRDYLFEKGYDVRIVIVPPPQYHAFVVVYPDIWIEATRKQIVQGKGSKRYRGIWTVLNDAEDLLKPEMTDDQKEFWEKEWRYPCPSPTQCGWAANCSGGNDS